MRVSVDISLYSLHSNYKEEIINFIEALKKESGVSLVVNGMSTQLFGEFDDVMNALNTQMKLVLSKEARSVLILKISQGDLTVENLPPNLR